MKLLALLVLASIGCATTGSVAPAEPREQAAQTAEQAAAENDAARQETIRQMHRQEARDTLARLCTTPDSPERQQWCVQMQQEQVRLDQEEQRIEISKRTSQASAPAAQSQKAEAEKPRKGGIICPTNEMGTTILRDCH